jgi:probable rRNA maturation factor
MPLTLTITATTGKPHARRLARLLRKAHSLLKTRVQELSVAIVGDKQMADLHESFMGIRGPTDVLTFELDHDPKGHVTAGEVVVNLHEAARAARDHRVPVADELLLYALHGLLHLSGYDDTTKNAYTKMHRKEDEILTALGIGPIFSPDTLGRNTGVPPVLTTSKPRRRRRPTRSRSNRSRQ